MNYGQNQSNRILLQQFLKNFWQQKLGAIKRINRIRSDPFHGEDKVSGKHMAFNFNRSKNLKNERQIIPNSGSNLIKNIWELKQFVFLPKKQIKKINTKLWGEFWKFEIGIKTNVFLIH